MNQRKIESSMDELKTKINTGYFSCLTGKILYGMDLAGNVHYFPDFGDNFRQQAIERGIVFIELSCDGGEFFVEVKEGREQEAKRLEASLKKEVSSKRKKEMAIFMAKKEQEKRKNRDVQDIISQKPQNWGNDVIKYIVEKHRSAVNAPVKIVLKGEKTLQNENIECNSVRGWDGHRREEKKTIVRGCRQLTKNKQ